MRTSNTSLFVVLIKFAVEHWQVLRDQSVLERHLARSRNNKHKNIPLPTLLSRENINMGFWKIQDEFAGKSEYMEKRYIGWYRASVKDIMAVLPYNSIFAGGRVDILWAIWWKIPWIDIQKNMRQLLVTNKPLESEPWKEKHTSQIPSYWVQFLGISTKGHRMLPYHSGYSRIHIHQVGWVQVFSLRWNRGFFHERGL